ncbi:hypothetical protein CTI12_AA570360 [Artemisia annua]|uniref:Zinc knuckle CX2CX4HX4C n=1 Tax=Artemisia annua TaxID=35608 RepID=A0A2U1KS89_ARTAN|nr:hypothetical protein CTI12_AA570360 [Artemisia annua]
MDRITTSMCERAYGRASFARVLIEVDAATELVDSVEVCYEKLGKSMNLRGEYAWKPPHCSQCKVFGHEDRNCSKKEVVAKDMNVKAKDVGINPGKMGDNNTEEGQWQDVRKFVNHGANTSRNYGQQTNGYYKNRGGFSNKGRGNVMGRGGMTARGDMAQRSGKEVESMKYVPVSNGGKKVDEGIIFDSNSKDGNGNINKEASTSKGNVKKKVIKQNEIKMKNSFGVLASEEIDDVEVGSEEWTQMRKKIDLACDLGMQIAESEKLRWSNDLSKYYEDKCNANARNRMIEGLKWRISKLQKDISYGHTNIAVNAKLKADELCKEIMKESGSKCGAVCRCHMMRIVVRIAGR